MSEYEFRERVVAALDELALWLRKIVEQLDHQEGLDREKLV